MLFIVTFELHKLYFFAKMIYAHFYLLSKLNYAGKIPDMIEKLADVVSCNYKD